MIPLRLCMRNFLGYRDSPPLSLEGIRLVCLSGDNGAGKSALLDAMTWALWGRARGVDERGAGQDNLVHQNEAEMEVELEFVAGPQRYRVRRQHARSRPGHPSRTILELQVASDDGFRPLTSNTIRETQRQIIDLLRLDYETFINSAFLLQGRANEFTLKRPAERKELLAEILGLSFYEHLEEMARQLRREREAQVRELEASIKTIEEDLSQKPLYQRELQQAQEALAELEPRLRSQEAELAGLRRRQVELDAKGEGLRQLESNVGQAKREQEATLRRKEGHQRLIVQYEDLLRQHPAIEQGFAQLQQARQEAQLWEEKSLTYMAFQQTRSRLERAIDRARAELEKELALLRQRVADRETIAQRLPRLQQALERAQAGLHNLQAQEEALKQKQQMVRELTEQVSGQQARLRQLEGELNSLKEKLDLLAQAEARCPLCETELGDQGRERLRDKYAGQDRMLRDNLAFQGESLKKMQGERQTLEREAEQTEARLKRERDSSHSQIATLERDLSQAREAEQALTLDRQSLEAREGQYARGDFALEQKPELARIDRQLQELGYDSQRHQEARNRQQSLQPYEKKKQELDGAEIRIQTERQAMAQAEADLAQGQKRLEELEEKRLALQTELTSRQEVEEKLRQAENDYRGLQARERELRDHQAAALSNLERCRAQEEALAQKRLLQQEAAREEDIYRGLAEAFGKKGIPALLIEEALPEIEAEANRLLARMTENRMHIKLETQREQRERKGEPIETLDIKISDELGSRDYEMFSGGEAFRIDFALRIALSRLLTHRRGAPLPTLIIDEGFGTQDTLGREKLVEAIASIQEEFEKILVITHVEEMKDQFSDFPRSMRIEVTKTPQGSTFRVVD